MRRFLPVSLTLLCLALAAPGAAHASPSEFVSFEAPRELLSNARASTLDQISAFGVTHVRQLVYWRQFAPRAHSRRKPHFNASDPNDYRKHAWDALDALMHDAAARHIEVMLTLTGPAPKWATRGKRNYRLYPSPKEFGEFATAVGRRYGAQVSLWSIWNEPNQPQFLGPQYVHGRPKSPQIYRALYKAAYKGIRSSPDNRRDKILIGETSPRGNRHVVAPLRFLRGMLCLNARYHKDRHCGELPAAGYAQHAYTTSTGPRFVPRGPDDVTIGVLSRLVRALNRAGAAHALPRHLPIYLTEFGIQSYPDRVSGVSLPRQAAYLAISEHIAYVNPRVASFSQYLMSDDPQERKHGYRFGGFESGLRFHNGRKKPSYNGFRLPLAVEAYGGYDVLWGLVRPNQRRTQVTIQVAPRHKRWRVLKTLSTTATGVYGLRVRHRNGQRYRVRWTDAAGHTYYGAAVRAY